MQQRCGWCSSDPLYIQYHDHEWGKACYDELQLFEMLCLEGQQAGLSWITVLKKRENYRQHFFQLSIVEISQLTNAEILTKSQDPGLIRHLGKLESIRNNATAWLALNAQDIQPVTWLWSFAPTPDAHLDIPDYRLLPSYSHESMLMSKALKKAGFSFVGPTTCYAFMQAVGMLNHHENHCYIKQSSHTM